MAIEDYYVTITKISKTKTQSALGGKTEAQAAAGTFKGAINQASSREAESAAKLGITADYKLYCPVTTVIDNDDLIQYAGEKFRVVSKPKNTMLRNHHYKILLKYVSDDSVVT